MTVISDFVSNQKRILQSEKEYCERKLIAERGDKRESFFGKVINKTVPPYGGTIVKFEILRAEENCRETNFKLGSIVEVRKGFNLKSGKTRLLTLLTKNIFD